MNFDALQINSRQRYRLLSGGVTPRPIAWISTCSKNGVDNIAPYSFFTVASCTPPVLLFTQVKPRTGFDKDTLQNLIETGECVVNVVSAELMEKMNMTSASLDAELSEFVHAGLEHIPSQVVTPLSVANSPVRYECTLRDTLAISDSPGSGTVVLLDVKSVYVRDDLFVDGVINQAEIDTVGKMGGDGYCIASGLVKLGRP